MGGQRPKHTNKLSDVQVKADHPDIHREGRCLVSRSGHGVGVGRGRGHGQLAFPAIFRPVFLLAMLPVVPKAAGSHALRAFESSGLSKP